jgi:hypothetical protein
MEALKKNQHTTIFHTMFVGIVCHIGATLVSYPLHFKLVFVLVFLDISLYLYVYQQKSNLTRMELRQHGPMYDVSHLFWGFYIATWEVAKS